MLQNPKKADRYNAAVRVCDSNGIHIFSTSANVARNLVALGAAIPNDGKRVWKLTLSNPPAALKIGPPKAPSIHSFKTAAPVYRETMGDGDQRWRSSTFAFKRLHEDLVVRLLAERVEQGIVRQTTVGYRRDLGEN